MYSLEQASDLAARELESRISDPEGVYVPSPMLAEEYLGELIKSIRRYACKPFIISATVSPPGFKVKPIGESVSGICLAHRSGYWLVFRPEDKLFYCFWGTDLLYLSAPGISGSPLYCWSA